MFHSSALGTKSYWDEYFARDLQLFADGADPGDEWFGSGAAHRVVNYVCSNFSPDTVVADVGCGNGLFLRRLLERGFRSVLGIDVCENAIRLTREVLTDWSSSVSLDIIDMTKRNVSLVRQVNVCCDKGTLDAIALSPDDRDEKLSAYVSNVDRLLTADGVFIITSCNFTIEELNNLLLSNFCLSLEIKQPVVYSFGGHSGKSVTQGVYLKLNK